MKNRFLLTSLVMINSALYNTVCDASTDESLSNNKNKPSYIIGGEDAALGEFPFFAALIPKGEAVERTFCGASLIDNKYVLTASHCFFGSNLGGDYEVVLNVVNLDNPGDSEIRRSVANVYHYKTKGAAEGGLTNDITLLELTEPVTEVEPISVVTREVWDQIKVGDPLTVIGFGVVEPDLRYRLPDLKKVEVPYYDFEKCRQNYDDSPDGGSLTQDMMCAGYDDVEKDSCQGDSGGPLFYTKDDKRYQVGVVSWGAQRCASPNLPGVYAKVSHFIDWIARVKAGIIIPNIKEIGSIEQGDKVEDSIMVKNVGDETFSVTKASFENPENVSETMITKNTCEGQQLSKNQSCEINYSYTVDEQAVTDSERGGYAAFDFALETTAPSTPAQYIPHSMTILESTSIDSKEILDIEFDNLISWSKVGKGQWEATTEEMTKGNSALGASVSKFQQGVIMMTLNPRVQNMKFDYWSQSDRADTFVVKLNNDRIIRQSGSSQDSFKTEYFELNEKTNRLEFGYFKDDEDRGEIGMDTAIIDNVRFDVRNTAPDIKVSAVKSAQAESTVKIDASKTTDPEKDTMTYSWKILGDTLGATISGEDSNTLKLKLGSQTGNLHYQLTVRDQYGAESVHTDKFKIEAKPKSGGSLNTSLLWLMMLLVSCRLIKCVNRVS